MRASFSAPVVHSKTPGHGLFEPGPSRSAATLAADLAAWKHPISSPGGVQSRAVAAFLSGASGAHRGAQPPNGVAGFLFGQTGKSEAQTARRILSRRE